MDFTIRRKGYLLERLKALKVHVTDCNDEDIVSINMLNQIEVLELLVQSTCAYDD